jgi:Spy/CpxP family protein refolding chaperone
MFSRNHIGKHGPGKPHEWLARQLNFNTEQQEKYNLLRQQHRNVMEPLLQHDRNLHDSLFMQLKQTQPDTVVVKQFVSAISNNRAQTEITTFYHFSQVRDLCTPQQQKKFDEVIGDALRMPPPGPGAHRR